MTLQKVFAEFETKLTWSVYYTELSKDYSPYIVKHGRIAWMLQNQDIEVAFQEPSKPLQTGRL